MIFFLLKDVIRIPPNITLLHKTAVGDDGKSNLYSITGYPANVRMKEGEDSTRFTNIGSGKKLISAIIGLTNDAGKPLIENNKIYDIKHANIILPPYDTCPNCNEPFNNPALCAEYCDSVIYRFGFESNEWQDHRSIYYFSTFRFAKSIIKFITTNCF